MKIWATIIVFLFFVVGGEPTLGAFMAVLTWGLGWSAGKVFT